MVQIAMPITGIAAGLKAPDSRRTATIIGVVFAVTIGAQTALVASADELSASGDVAIYSTVQVVSLLVALGIARVLHSRCAATA